jgi:hypothetical protein
VRQSQKLTSYRDFSKSETDKLNKCDQAKLSLKLFTGQDAKVVKRAERNKIEGADRVEISESTH